MLVRSLFSALLLALVSSSALAQSGRPVPGNNGSAAFVEQADPGAMCPSCQVLLLRDSYTLADPVDVYAEAKTVVKPTSDVLIYDGATGHALLVKSYPYGYMPGGFSVLSINEMFTWLMLREGMFWSAGDLDGDGRDDLIGHDKRTGEVVRVYRRGPR